MKPERDRMLLIITDDRITYRRMEVDLAGIVSRIYFAESIEEGLRLAHTERPALLFVAETLPDGAGLAFVRMLRDEVEYRGMRIIMLREDADEYYRAAALERGASGVIPPRSSALLVQTVVRSELRAHDLWRRQEGARGRDGLTGLMDFETFRDHAVSRLAGVRRFGGSYWLLTVELTNLLEINKEHGFRIGDRMLRTIAEQMRTVASNGDLLSHLHGGRFQLLVERSSESAVETLTRRIVEGPFADRIYFKLGLRADLACRSVAAGPEFCTEDDFEALIEKTLSPSDPGERPPLCEIVAK